jgi:hypothetical protein
MNSNIEKKQQCNYRILLNKISQCYIEGQTYVVLSNLNYMRLFYLLFPICETPSHKFSWSHYCEFMKIDDELKKSFCCQHRTKTIKQKSYEVKVKLKEYTPLAA